MAVAISPILPPQPALAVPLSRMSAGDDLAEVLDSDPRVGRGRGEPFVPGHSQPSPMRGEEERGVGVLCKFGSRLANAPV